jgi:hypothetical protein
LTQLHPPGMGLCGNIGKSQSEKEQSAWHSVETAAHLSNKGTAFAEAAESKSA